MAPGLVGLYCNVTGGINIKEKKSKEKKVGIKGRTIRVLRGR